MESRSSVRQSGPLYRNLLRREVRQRYRGSVLGLGWTLINPLLLVGAYWLVFRFLFGSPIPHFALFMFVGLIVWTLMFGGILLATSSLVANAALVTKVRFPRAIIPLASTSANAVTTLAMLVIAVPLCLVLRTGSSLEPLLLLPGFLILGAIFAAGAGLLLGALNVYFRDLEHIVAAFATAWFFLTPIFYTFESLPPTARQYPWVIDLLHYGNPLSPFVIVVQDTLFFGVWPTLTDSLYCLIAAVLMFAIGWVGFRRLEREMAIAL